MLTFGSGHNEHKHVSISHSMEVAKKIVKSPSKCSSCSETQQGDPQRFEPRPPHGRPPQELLDARDKQMQEVIEENARLDASIVEKLRQLRTHFVPADVEAYGTWK